LLVVFPTLLLFPKVPSPTLGNSRIVATFVRKVLNPATRRDGNGKASKMQASIGQYVVRQHVDTLGRMHTSEKVSVTDKESSEYAPNRLGLQT